jgi:hypothetical protein
VATEAAGTQAARFLPFLALAHFEPGKVCTAAEKGAHQGLGSRDVDKSNSNEALVTRQFDRWRCALRQKGGLATRAASGRTPRSQGGSPKDGLSRGVHVLFANKAALRSGP